MIPSNIIEEIRSKADIVAVVSEYVSIKKRGKNYLGLCPFHAEKDASFTVSPEKQLFHCFGCNEGGNVFAFLMKIENIGFAEAVEELGAKVGISVPKASASPASRTEKEKLNQVMLLAAKFYQSAFDQAARDYLAKRGITEKTAQFFGLGYAPAGWDNLFKHLVARGVAPNLIERSGLILPRENQTGYYDRFRNRLIFTVSDQRDRAVAFSGRSLGDEEPKYLNSPDTLIYHKGETLYGLSLTKESIKRAKTAVMVEGNLDLLSAYQAGITNSVATLGTALTVAQCKLLARYCDTVIAAFDADAAGGAAAEKSIEPLKNQGLKVKVAQLSGGKDPDEIIRNQGAEAFKQCLDAALPQLEFKIKRILSRHDLKEIESRSKALKEVAAVLGQENDDFIQKEYAKLAAAWLKTDAETLLAETKRMKHYAGGSRDRLRRVTEKPSSRVEEAEKHLLALATQDREALNALKQNLAVDSFTLPASRAVAELLFGAEFDNGTDPAHFILDNVADEEAKKFLSRILMDELPSEGEKRARILDDCLKVIRDEQMKVRIQSLKLELVEAENAGQTEKAAELLSVLKSEISWEYQR